MPQETFTDKELLDWLEENVAELTAMRRLSNRRDFLVTWPTKSGLLVETAGTTLRKALADCITEQREGIYDEDPFIEPTPDAQ